MKSEFEERLGLGPLGPSLEVKRVNVDFPKWMVEALDRESQRLGITRQGLIKVWIAERLGGENGSR